MKLGQGHAPRPRALTANKRVSGAPSPAAPVCSRAQLRTPRVLDGDDGLVGENLEQLDLLLAKWTHLGAPDRNRPNCFAIADQWLNQHGAKTKSVGKVAALCVLFSFSLQIRDLNRSPV